jgi:putative Holliday junction resolvase
VRILGVDLGATRTGLALSDPLGITCSPLRVIVERDGAQTMLRVVEAAREHGVNEIVVGVPRPLRGGSNPQLESAERFARGLEALGEFKVSVCDERFTTKLAERGRSRDSQQDSIAACYILQGYLDSISTSREQR